jgi:hypothetical protein
MALFFDQYSFKRIDIENSKLKIPTNKLAIIIASLLFCVSYCYAQPSFANFSIEVRATQALEFGVYTTGWYSRHWW